MTQITSVTPTPPTTATPGTAPAAAPASRCPFPAAECDVFHAQDRHAATAVVGIMVAIFILAVLGYTFVAFLAAGGGS